MKEDMLKPKNNPFADTRYPIEMDAEIKELDLWGAEFDQYISPFSLAISHGIDEATMNAFVNVGVTVDKEELLKALQYDRNQFAAGFKAGKKAAQPKWISVEERLPEEDGRCVLCAVKDYWGVAVCEGYYSKVSNRIWPNDQDCALGKVTHWMPMPTPPKEDV